MNLIKKGIRFFRRKKHAPKPASSPVSGEKGHAGVPAERERRPAPEKPSFRKMDILPEIQDILARLKFIIPTPIQEKAVPHALAGEDVIGIAQTGTGKTLAFCIPIYQYLLQGKGRALILLPTRELALQVDDAFQQVGKAFGMRTTALIGGVPIEYQYAVLKQKPRILIATPGRLIDHMERGYVKLDDIKTLVLDEADRMLDMGFLPQVHRILNALEGKRQTMLFSATMPPEIIGLMKTYMKTPVSIEVAPSGTVADKITQELFVVSRESKMQLLKKLLNRHRGSVLLFSRTKHGAKKIARQLQAAGHRAADIHSDLSLLQRNEALRGFKSGKYRILVATDIASRGIDVKNIGMVVNFDIPEDAESYVHRIGRTGRIGGKGHAVTFASRDQKKDVENIERFIKASLPVSSDPDMPRELFGNKRKHAHGKDHPGSHRGSRGGRKHPGRKRRR